MAIDTAVKRRQALNASIPTISFYPDADGTVDDIDRAYLWHSYFAGQELDTITEGTGGAISTDFSGDNLVGKAWLGVTFTDLTTTRNLYIETGVAPDTITEGT